jgi:uncharacterized repeat protein (TIGR01451 family)
MREVSGAGIRGFFRARGCLFALLAGALFGAPDAHAQMITRYVRDTGNINFVTTGGSMRTQPNSAGAAQACLVSNTSSQTLSGIPAGTTIRSAYLYWGGSGTTNDTTVTFNGSTISASRTFSTTVPFNASSHAYFGDFADVTSIVSITRNGTYTLSNLTVNTGNPWCNNGLVTGGWSLIVIYESPTERLRAINVFDGMDYFYGSSLTTTPDGFRVPATGIDGRIGVFTLDGDPGNSDPIGGFSESLRYNGTFLDDGINVAGSVPTVQQFDGTINTQGIATSYGIDVDQYDISSLLTPGATSGTILYSAGGDVVVLMAQVVSATSDPAVDLSVTKTHSGTFVSGGTGTYTITVSNAAGVEREDNTVTVTDTLPAGLSYNAGTGTGWTCGAAAQVVTCTHPPTLNAGASLPPITLVVNVGEAAAASVNNSVTVSSASFDSNSTNNTATDATATIDPNVSTSTKTVVDVNGGEATPGDTLRYTITLTESAGGQAVNVSLTDSIPDNTTFGGFVAIPAGAASSFSAAPAGANGLGLITVSGITVPASGSVTVVFDVTVTAGTLPGEVVNNTATINNPNGPENNPAAPTVTVNPSLIPSTGSKFLYLHRDGSGNRSLSRAVPGASDTNETVVNGGPDAFTIAPPLRTAFSIASGAIPVRLWLTRSSNNPTSRNITVTLTASDGFSTTVTNSVTPPTGAIPTLSSFSLPNAAAHTFPVGTTFTLTVSQNGTNNVVVYPNGNGTAGSNSRIEFNATTVINVDSVQAFNAAFNGGAVQATFYPGATVFVRAQVSDPFGSFDIGGATVTIIDPSNVTQVSNVAMTAQGAPATCNSQAAATCVFQYAYTVPASPSLGGWTVRVTASEGTEGTVTDLGVGNFTVAIPQPTLTIVKTSSVVSDPVNSTTNPKRIPSSVVRYDVTLTNSGPGTIDAGTLVLTDPVPANAAMYVSTASGNPVVFVNGTTASGLTYNYATNVSYSSAGPGGPWTYTPVPDVDGFDPVVRAVRIAPTGVMSAAGSGNPSFTIQFRIRIN